MRLNPTDRKLRLRTTHSLVSLRNARQ